MEIVCSKYCKVKYLGKTPFRGGYTWIGIGTLIIG